MRNRFHHFLGVTSTESIPKVLSVLRGKASKKLKCASDGRKLDNATLQVMRQQVERPYTKSRT